MKFIQHAFSGKPSTELKEAQKLIDATEDYIAAINQNSRNKLITNHELAILTGIIQHLENNYSEIPDSIYEKILRCNSVVQTNSWKNFRKEFS